MPDPIPQAPAYFSSLRPLLDRLMLGASGMRAGMGRLYTGGRERLADLAEMLPLPPTFHGSAPEPPPPPVPSEEQAQAVGQYLRGTGGMGVGTEEELKTKAQLMRELNMGVLPRGELPPDAGDEWRMWGLGKPQ